MEIEKDIKILEKFKDNEIQRDKLERDNRCGGWKIGDIYKKLELNIAIEHILVEREADKKRIKKLEEKLLDMIKGTENIKKETPEYIKENYIPVQTVKDVLQKNRNELFSTTYIDDKRYKPYTMQIDRINKIEKELLEDK